MAKSYKNALKNAQKNDRTFTPQQWYLFPHCTEITAMPSSGKEWQHIFATFSQQLQVESVGCCGMAGVFGHETQHIAMSKEIYASSWQKITGAKILTSA